MKNKRSETQMHRYSSKYIQLFFIIFFSGSAISATTVNNTEKSAGQLTSFEGKILVRHNKTSKPQRIETPETALHVGYKLRTQKDSKAFIRWFDGSKIVMKEKSQLSINAIDYFDVGNGSVIFDIAKVERPKPIRVGVKLAILGIRGTQFIVTTEKEGYNVYLKEGDITITSLTDDFKIYTKQIESQMKQFRKAFEQEVEKFSTDMKREFDAFKKEIELGESERIKEFKLIESAGIAIKDGVITLIPIPQNIDEQFKLLEKF